MGKKIKKAVSKTIGGGLLGGSKEKAPKVQEVAAPAPAAQVVEAPKEDSTEVDESTESAKKAARARGKRGLSVARSSGSGLNI
ncbi:hypothetical protein [Pseudomonas sp.]|jgi:hypothetical protein|uniref:hypothetical protein n=1 Tax=Pseudomonas sp. TaxID=306 RepID=UPI0037C9B64C